MLDVQKPVTYCFIITKHSYTIQVRSSLTYSTNAVVFFSPLNFHSMYVLCSLLM